MNKLSHGQGADYETRITVILQRSIHNSDQKVLPFYIDLLKELYKHESTM